MPNRILATLCVCVLTLFGPLAQARSIFWEALEVAGTLDHDGRLRVVERHTMIFDGDWNGGERRFRVDDGQQLFFAGMFELDPLGARKALRSGNLSSVGEYQIFDGNVLRWRARLPTDPPFKRERRIYEIEYELTGVIVRFDNSYLLDHDFAFADRPGSIIKFTASLTLDPVWQASKDSAFRLERTNLAPGAGAVLYMPLSYRGEGVPKEIAPTLIERIWNAIVNLFASDADPSRYIAVWTLIGLICVRSALWYRHDHAMGKFADVTGDINREWIQSNLLRYAPEFVGAAWDLTTSSNEVMAVIARMTQEGKLKS
jgi:hypothetical protein